MKGSLAGRHVVLGVTAGIAAYKSPELARLLAQRGAEVRVVLTATAAHFIRPAAFESASQPLLADCTRAAGSDPLASWADLVLVAPATADFLARLALGRTNDLLTAICVATEAPVIAAPAMNHVMWSSTATGANISRLTARGIRFLGPAYGEMAEGEVGVGRMMEPADIVAVLRES